LEARRFHNKKLINQSSITLSKPKKKSIEK